MSSVLPFEAKCCGPEELVARVASGESLELRRTKLAELRSLVEGA